MTELAENLTNNYLRSCMRFNRHPLELGNQLAKIALEYPELHLNFLSLEEIGESTGTIFNVWNEMDLKNRDPEPCPTE